jgi:GLPGLI family protein
MCKTLFIIVSVLLANLSVGAVLGKISVMKTSLSQMGKYISLTIVFSVLITTTGLCQKKTKLPDLNSKEMVQLGQKEDMRINKLPKQLSPYDAKSLGISLNPMLSYCRDVSKFKTIDQGEVRILYAFNATDISDANTYDDLQRLEIGKKYAKYYGFFVYETDSFTTEEKEEFNRICSMNLPIENVVMVIRGKHQGWSRYLFSEFFTDLTQNEMTEYCRMPQDLDSYDCYYKEPVPKQDWQISNDTTTIAGYLCQKATCNFRGRNYTAWFTVDIPISMGPWKFNGLPGLILKVYDDALEYNFECVGIEQRKYPIILLDNYKSYRKTMRTELDKTLKHICENYYQITGMTNVISKQLRPYNPMELK